MSTSAPQPEPPATKEEEQIVDLRNPLLAALPRVTLAEGGVSRYRLRKAPGPGALSTVEAIVQALETLEAPTSFALLLKPFEALIEGQIAAMGEEVYQRNHSEK